jgi:hypothetical protein
MKKWGMGMNDMADLPSGWMVGKLDTTLVQITSGFACAKTKTVSHGLPHLRPYNVDVNGNVDLSQLVYIPEDFVSNVETYYLQQGDVLFVTGHDFCRKTVL